MNVKFTQVVGKEDIYNYNMFFFQKKSKTIYFTYIIGLVALGLAIYYFINANYTVGIIWVLLFVYSFFLHRLFTKWQIRSMINKRKELDNNIIVHVEMDDEGFTYSTEETGDNQKMLWDNIIEIYDYKNYWYIYYSPNRAVFVRKSDCPDTNSVEEELKEKLQKRYKIVKARQ